ncbi:phosphoribosylglycinamide formyltransferase [Eudoraea chungangensis]|uniref:phosphoribosylglycinamide formyltransferase n=1 Tax=Eudoraea chungangensis TaxID=1481905 RepID=UPI0023EB5E0D|nr:phosphoribosylglycinamide formyltransferase [Eudoraea chungangensis]
MKRIILFASGSGSNVENIYNYFKENKAINIDLVLTNKKDALVLERCQRLGIACMYFNKIAFTEKEIVLCLLKSLNPDLIVLAGFLLKIPQSIVHAFPDKIINIHPALLPKYGGKGMYGHRVHQAIKENNEKETGISIHFVNENYDEGSIIKQVTIPVPSQATAEEIGAAVHQLEYQYFPVVIKELLDQDK